MRLVIVESPLAANLGRSVKEHVRYAKACMRDCLLRGEAPFASHLLYAQPGILDDLLPLERMLGIDAGLAWGEKADATVVYQDCGISRGMMLGIERAKKAGRTIEYRTVENWK